MCSNGAVSDLRELAKRPAFELGRRMMKQAFRLEVILCDFDGAEAHQRGAVRVPPCEACKEALFAPDTFERCAAFYRELEIGSDSTCHLGLHAMSVPIEKSAHLVVSGFARPGEGGRAPRPVELRDDERARVRGMMEAMADELGARESAPPLPHGMVGRSPQMLRVFEQIDRLAASDATVLVRGESGTGKELAARAIHDASDRSERPFVAQNCAALPEPLLESLLFGHVRGAFSGADRNSAGLFAAAASGTLFLDEVGEMSPRLQTRMLRVLQDGSYSPVGSTETRSSSARVIAATHRDLSQMVEQGEFRQDLFYRLNVLRLEMPPLRSRAGDVRALVETMAENAGLPLPDEEAWRCIERYRWPGNVRELQAEIVRWGVLGQDRLHIGVDDLSDPIRDAGGHAPLLGGDVGTSSLELAPCGTLADAIAQLEERMIRAGMERTDGNRTQLAKDLAISRTTLNERLKRYDID